MKKKPSVFADRLRVGREQHPCKLWPGGLPLARRCPLPRLANAWPWTALQQVTSQVATPAKVPTNHCALPLAIIHFILSLNGASAFVPTTRPILSFSVQIPFLQVGRSRDTHTSGSSALPIQRNISLSFHPNSRAGRGCAWEFYKG